MVFQSNLRYENAKAELKEVSAGVYVIETNAKPVYSYFRPDSKTETADPEHQPAQHDQEPGSEQ